MKSTLIDLLSTFKQHVKDHGNDGVFINRLVSKDAARTHKKARALEKDKKLDYVWIDTKTVKKHEGKTFHISHEDDLLMFA